MDNNVVKTSVSWIVTKDEKKYFTEAQEHSCSQCESKMKLYITKAERERAVVFTRTRKVGDVQC